ncbi:type II restriction endonuclease, partial [candidate division KSB3 bacterium]|nr:type II restriction endonuclease [candidate division KSB3 bacterium]
IDALPIDLPCAYVDLRDYADLRDDQRLIALFKLLSPQHLLKLPFANDSNTLDKGFYSELLHIIGLTETKQRSKKLIERNPPEARQPGSLLENTIVQLDSLEKLARLENPEQFGDTPQERLFSVALELAITWINRVLFLKLLEAQLLAYHKGDRAYAFLNAARIHDFDELNSLFFQVLARTPEERTAEMAQKFAAVPYLNSSLFDPTELEHQTVFISNLHDARTLPLHPATVLKDATGKKRTGEMNTLAYLFEFLDAYDFASEGAEEIQEENKSLINASVLGLIFEKINGYKDGSFFTPGFITMYMCRETLRRAVVQKFNAAKGWACQTLDDLYDQIDDRQEANAIINRLKICDPAVGSGHFLVSALNELIAIKSELHILQDRSGRRLKEYQVEVVNDELVITDDEGDLFEYRPRSPESQRVQEALFHEKQTLIEHCLFGVDINPNSVKICRLRLWIELLKHAYYRPASPESVIARSTATKQSPPPPSLPAERGPGGEVSPPSSKGAGGMSPSSSSPSLQAGRGQGWGSSSPSLPAERGPGGEVSPRRLETLPNIDINIKCGNALISRYPLKADIRQMLSTRNWDIKTYRRAVQTYRHAASKAEKRDMERLIADIKQDVRTEISRNDPTLKRLRKLRADLETLLNQQTMFDDAKQQKARQRQQRKLEQEIAVLEAEIEDLKTNKIYANAFEWRFEFPEVLDDTGDFVGFDAVIGNPPYIRSEELGKFKAYLKQNFAVFVPGGDIFSYFYELSHSILREHGKFCFINNTYD